MGIKGALSRPTTPQPQPQPYRMRPGGYFYGGMLGNTGATQVIGDLWASPIVFSTETKIDALAVECTSAIAGALLRLGIYADNGSGFPERLIVEAGAASGAGTGDKIITVQRTMAAGLYWLASLAEAGAAGYRGGTIQHHLLGIIPNSGQPAGGWYLGSVAAGALPVVFPPAATLGNGATTPRVRVRTAP